MSVKPVTHPYFVCDEPVSHQVPYLTIRLNRAPYYAVKHLRAYVYQPDAQRLVVAAVSMLDREQRIDLLRHIASTL